MDYSSPRDHKVRRGETTFQLRIVTVFIVKSHSDDQIVIIIIIIIIIIISVSAVT